MNYSLMPSLEHRTLVRIAVTLWGQDDVLEFFNLVSESKVEMQKKYTINEWPKIENKVIDKVSKLLLPKSLKKKIVNFIKIIGFQILKFMGWHYKNHNCAIDLPKQFCWTPQGTIDKKETAKAFIRDETLDIAQRYKVACFYCLENDIKVLWSKLPKNQNKSFSENDARETLREIVGFWNPINDGEVRKLDNMTEERWCKYDFQYETAFIYSTVCGNYVATEYFFKKLIPEERQQYMVMLSSYVATRCKIVSNYTDPHEEDHADILCFLLSQLNEKQEVEMFKRNPSDVLKAFLIWPWQSLFMKTANCMWNFLHEEHFGDLLGVIIKKVEYGYKDCNYQKLFVEFWQQSPRTLKKYVLDQCGWLLLKLFEVKDEKIISLILDCATIAEKEKIIFCCEGKNICKSLAYSNEWDLLKFFISECLSSQEKLIKLKADESKIFLCLPSKKELEEEKDIRNKFSLLLDNLIQTVDKKRGMEDGNSGPAMKRLHS